MNHPLIDDSHFQTGQEDQKNGLPFDKLASEAWKVGWTASHFSIGLHHPNKPFHSFHKYALDPTVLVVASLDLANRQWAAYIKGVKGKNHLLEWREVAHTGDKLPEELATILFPDPAAYMRWRD